MKNFVLRKAIFIILFILFCTPLFGQYECDYLGTPEERNASYADEVGFLYDSALEPYDLSQKPEWIDIGIAIHIVKNQDGTLGLSDSALESGLAELKKGFDQTHISFHVIKRDTIEDPDGIYASPSLSDEENLSSGHSLSNTVNIYYLTNLSINAAGLSTFTDDVANWRNIWLPNECKRDGQYILIEKSSAGTTTLPHEMGHYFDLFHTYDASLGADNNGNEYEKGDLIPDTPPAKESMDYDCESSYPDDKKLAENYMSKNTDLNCRSKFTTGQVRKIRYTLFERRPEYIMEMIQLTNIIDNQDAGGKLRATQGNQTMEISSGDTVALKANTNATIETMNERFVLVQRESDFCG